MKAYSRSERGASAVEMALWITVLAIPFMNVIDLGFYIFRTMQVREAAQAGAEFVSTVCGYGGKNPAATNCSTATNTAIQNAMQTTSLGSNVTLNTSTNQPQEGYYCTSRSGALTATSSSPWNLSGGSPGTLLTNCSSNSAGNTGAAGDYVFVTANYSYSPIFSSVSLLSTLRSSSTISQTAWVRIN